MSLEKLCKELEAWKLKAEVNFELAEDRSEKLNKIQRKLEWHDKHCQLDKDSGQPYNRELHDLVKELLEALG